MGFVVGGVLFSLLLLPFCFSLVFLLFLSGSSENSIFYRKDRTCLSPLATFATVVLAKGQQLREKINKIIACFLDPCAFHSEQLN